MKNRIKLAISCIAFLFVFLPAFCQAQNPPLPGAAPAAPTLESTNLAPFTITDLFSGGFKHAAQDAVSFIENTTNAGVVTVEGGALYAIQTKKVGGFLDAYFPVGGTNSIFGAGFGLAYLDHNFYDATLNARVGDTFNLPFVHIPLYAYTEAGGGYNLGKNQIISQAFAGAVVKIPVNKTQTFTIGAALGTISDEPGQILAAGASYTFSW